MKKHTKLIVLISSFCLILAIGLFGVLAVTSLNFSMGGRVFFTAEGVNAKIYDAQFSGMTVSDATAFKTFTVSTDSENPSEGYATWGKSGITYNIDSTGEGTASIKVENTSTNNEKIKVETTITGSTEALTISANAGAVIGQGATHTIVITFTVGNKNVNASADFTVAIKLSLQGEVTYDTTQTGSVMTASVSDEKATIAYTGNETDVVIPNFVKTESGTYPVTAIAANSFTNKTNIRTITILDGVTTVDCSFWGCTNLTELIIPETVTNFSSTFGGSPESFGSYKNLTIIIKGSPLMGNDMFEFAEIGTIIFEGDVILQGSYNGDGSGLPTFQSPAWTDKIVVKGNVGGNVLFSQVKQLWIENKEFLQNNTITDSMIVFDDTNDFEAIYISKDIAQYAQFSEIKTYNVFDSESLKTTITELKGV